MPPQNKEFLHEWNEEDEEFVFENFIDEEGRKDFSSRKRAKKDAFLKLEQINKKISINEQKLKQLESLIPESGPNEIHPEHMLMNSEKSLIHSRYRNQLLTDLYNNSQEKENVLKDLENLNKKLNIIHVKGYEKFVLDLLIKYNQKLMVKLQEFPQYNERLASKIKYFYKELGKFQESLGDITQKERLNKILNQE
jgi:hypothetical protein